MVPFSHLFAPVVKEVAMIDRLDTLPDSLARDVIAHLCGDDCHGVGETVELCESRGDCYIVVTCGGCGTAFTLEDEQYESLLAWTAARGDAPSCGIAALRA